MDYEPTRIRRLLLTTSSALALIAGLNTMAEAVPVCVPVPAGGTTISTEVDCIEVTSLVTGNIVNTSTGFITNTQAGHAAGGPPFSTNAIVVVSTLSGTITNSGTIGAIFPGATGIRRAIHITGIVTGGITSSGTIEASGGTEAAGIYISAPTSFGGGITNSGLVNGHAHVSAFGIDIRTVSTFSGGILNSGTVVASAGTKTAAGISVLNVPTFLGGASRST